ncbi:MAG: hypothetical protein JWN48_4141 [Myxococcaceae bacterium]|nr:hypothetical protein [Myxococcaceae bacterium]
MRRTFRSILLFTLAAGCAESPALESALDPNAPDLSEPAAADPAPETGAAEGDDQTVPAGPEQTALRLDAGAGGAASSRDASVKLDAGRDAAVRTASAGDGGAHATSSQPTSTKPASASTNTCRAATDCTTPCIPVGLFSCCRLDQVCGCTWAPGAYCL